MKKAENCNCLIIHEEIVNKVKKLLPDEFEIDRLSEFFKIMGDPTRLNILHSLITAEMCVCDISGVLNMTHSSISHQLRILKQANLVKNRKEGKVVYYSLFDDHVKQIFNIGFDHINERG